ncbi:O-methyltransferase, partial [Tanacetum coccineum]
AWCSDYLMTSIGIYGGWALPPLSTRLCTHYTIFARPNGRLFGNHKVFSLTTNCLSDMVVTIASDHSYGNKEVISVTPRIYDYLLTNVREPPILRELREETASMRGSQMQVSPDQAQLLAMLVQILGARRCIE